MKIKFFLKRCMCFWIFFLLISGKCALFGSTAHALYPDHHYKDWVPTANFVWNTKAVPQSKQQPPFLPRELYDLSLSSDKMLLWHMQCAGPLIQARNTYDQASPSPGIGANNLFAMISTVYSVDEVVKARGWEKDSSGGSVEKQYIWHYPITEGAMLKIFPSGEIKSSSGDPYNAHSEGLLVQHLEAELSNIKEEFLRSVSSVSLKKIDVIIINIASYMDACFNCRTCLKTSLHPLLSKVFSSPHVPDVPEFWIFYSGINDYKHFYPPKMLNPPRDKNLWTRDPYVRESPPLDRPKAGPRIFPDLIQFYHVANPYRSETISPKDPKTGKETGEKQKQITIKAGVSDIFHYCPKQAEACRSQH